MRKTYKPFERTQKATEIYKKKTLNVNDILNVKHDENDIEDIDEYWNAAQSVIGDGSSSFIEDTVVTEQSDTLFNLKNIRKSIKKDENNSNIDEIYRKSIKNSISKNEDANSSMQILNTQNNEKNSEDNSTKSPKKRLTFKPNESMNSNSLIDLSEEEKKLKLISASNNEDQHISVNKKKKVNNQRKKKSNKANKMDNNPEFDMDHNDLSFKSEETNKPISKYKVSTKQYTL